MGVAEVTAQPPSAFQALEKVHAAGSGLYGSAGELFADAVFGRDSVECADDLLRLRPDIAVEVILALARLQGTVDAAPGPGSNEEEVGKIHHEHRSLLVGTRRISPRSQELLEYLSAMWGGDGETLTYYGSVDATPLYVRLIGRFCGAYGQDVLSQPLVNRDQRLVTVRDSLLAAVRWMQRKIEASSLNLLEFCRTNPRGIPFQAWKDSGTSYIHRDGTIADYTQPIASVEVQGYAYDALQAAATLLPEESAQCSEVAASLRRSLMARFWMPEQKYFAMGLDRGPGGEPRQIESVSSNAALLLASTVFDDLPEGQHYVESLVARTCGPEFLTDVGVRCRSLNEDGLVDFQDYHGTWACWPKDGHDVACGLERQGFTRLAEQLYWRLVNGVNLAGAAVEFLYVSPAQGVHYDFQDHDPVSDHPVEIHGTNRPEPLQAWTVTAMLAIKSRERLRSDPAPAIEEAVLQTMPYVEILRTAADRAAAYARRGDFVLNTQFGAERDQAARAAGKGQSEPVDA